MGLEIERKFLVKHDLWKAAEKGQHMMQGYIANNEKQLSVRVRIAGDKAWLNIKGRVNDIVRQEYEYPIPVSDAQELLDNFAGNIVEKVRYNVEYDGHNWEVDEFSGANSGLIVAELELVSEQQQFMLPPWAGQEVSNDPRYLNTSLAEFPYNKWSDK